MESKTGFLETLITFLGACEDDGRGVARLPLFGRIRPSKAFHILFLHFSIFTFALMGEKRGVAAPNRSSIVSNDSEEDLIGSFPIKMIPLENHQSLVNSFLEDCMNSLTPPKNYFDKIEVQRTQTNKFYLLRLMGRIPVEETLDFSHNFFEFIDAEGQSEKLRFNSKDFKIQRDEEGLTTLSFIVPSPRTIHVGLTFHQKFDQRYDLVIEINENGVVKTAFFKPVLNLERRKTFCPKSFTLFQFGGSLAAYQQKMHSIESEVFSTPVGMALNMGWSRTVSLREQQILDLEIQQKLMNLPAYDLGGEQSHPQTLFQGQYLWKFQEDRFKRFRKSTVIAPYWQAGLGFKQGILYEFEKADTTHWEYNSTSSIIGGLGVNFYISEKFMLDISSDFHWKIYGQGSVKNSASILGQTRLLYQPNWKWKTTFVGWSGKSHLEQISYQRNQGLDQNGTVNALTLETAFFIGRRF